MSSNRKNHIDEHHAERVKHNKILGKHPTWEVFKHNLAKLFLIDMLSRSFIILVMSILFTGWLMGDQISSTKHDIEWAELVVALAPPTFFAYYWVERKRASEILRSIAEGVKAFFQNRK